MLITQWYFASKTSPEIIEVIAVDVGSDRLFLNGGTLPIQGESYSFHPTRQAAEKAKRAYEDFHPL